MKKFVNKNYDFRTRDYEATNVVGCLSEEAPNENYTYAPWLDLSAFQPLWIENGVQFYGYL